MVIRNLKEWLKPLLVQIKTPCRGASTMPLKMMLCAKSPPVMWQAANHARGAVVVGEMFFVIFANYKIFRPVVMANPIQMMNLFGRLKIATYLFLGNKAMLVHSALGLHRVRMPSGRDADVSICVFNSPGLEPWRLLRVHCPKMISAFSAAFRNSLSPVIFFTGTTTVHALRKLALVSDSLASSFVVFHTRFKEGINAV